LVGKHEGKRPLGKPKYKYVNNIKIYLRGGNAIDCIFLAQCRVRLWAFVYAVMKLLVP
jgi:hypothetical protein